MIQLTSLEGPDVWGPNRYKVVNPALSDSTRKLRDWGLSNRNIMINGELVFCHHVSHNNHDYEAGTFIIVCKPLLKAPRYQCKDISTLTILEFLKSLLVDDGRSTLQPKATWGESHSMPTVNAAIPDSIPKDRNLILAKMQNLIHRGLVEGCDCGCRGDYVITDKGLAYLEKHSNESPIRMLYHRGAAS